MRRFLLILSVLLLFTGAGLQARVHVVRDASSDSGPDAGPAPEQNPGPMRSEPSRGEIHNGGWGGRSASVSPGRVRVVRPGSDVPVYHGGVAGNRVFVERLHQERPMEAFPRRYYWHDWGGHRYVHYYDNRLHWYGFYYGPSFYWTTYYGNCWWWRDPIYYRWAFWWDGYWWWPGPTGTMYVYLNNAYVPYDPDTLNVPEPTAPAPPPESAHAAVPSTQADSSLTSPDGNRMVQIVGASADAFLYDVSSGKPVFMRHLAANVERVRFAGGQQGRPLQILVDTKDGGFILFGASGAPLSPAAAVNAAPGATPPASTTPPPAPPSY